MRSGDNNEAYEQRIVEANACRNNISYKRGMNHFYLKNYKKAIPCFEKTINELKLRPGNELEWKIKGLKHYSSKEFFQAIYCFRNAISSDSTRKKIIKFKDFHDIQYIDEDDFWSEEPAYWEILSTIHSVNLSNLHREISQFKDKFLTALTRAKINTEDPEIMRKKWGLILIEILQDEHLSCVDLQKKPARENDISRRTKMLQDRINLVNGIENEPDDQSGITIKGPWNIFDRKTYDDFSDDLYKFLNAAYDGDMFAVKNIYEKNKTKSPFFNGKQQDDRFEPKIINKPNEAQSRLVTKADYYGRTALLLAAKNGKHEIMIWLLKYCGAAIGDKDLIGRTALLHAAANGYLYEVQWLLRESGANVNEKDAKGRTALLWAASRGHLVIVQYLLLKHNVSIEERDCDGKTAFLAAVEGGHCHVALWLLIKAGSSLDEKDSMGRTAFVIAFFNRDVGMMLFLYKIYIAIKEHKKNTDNIALSLIFMIEHEYILKILVINKECTSFLNEENCIDTKLISAACNGIVARVQPMLKEKRGHFTEENDILAAVLMFAVSYNRLELVKWVLIESGYVVNKKRIEDIHVFFRKKKALIWLDSGKCETSCNPTVLWLSFYVFLATNSFSDPDRFEQLDEIFSYQTDDHLHLWNASISLIFSLFKFPEKEKLGLTLFNLYEKKLQPLLTEEQNKIVNNLNKMQGIFEADACKNNDSYKTGMMHLFKKQYERAIIYFEKALKELKVEPDNELEWKKRGIAHYAANEYVNAIDCFRKAISSGSTWKDSIKQYDIKYIHQDDLWSDEANYWEILSQIHLSSMVNLNSEIKSCKKNFMEEIKLAHDNNNEQDIEYTRKKVGLMLVNMLQDEHLSCVDLAKIWMERNKICVPRDSDKIRKHKLPDVGHSDVYNNAGYLEYLKIRKFFNSVSDGKLPVVKSCLRAGWMKIDVRDLKCRTALLFAAISGRLAVVQWLLQEGGAKVDEEDLKGRTALLHAAINGHLPVVQWLLKEGGAKIDERDLSGCTALLCAVANRHLALTQWLLSEGGAKIDEGDFKGNTASSIAFHNCDFNMILFLLKKYKVTDNEKEKENHIALSLSFMMEHEEIIKKLSRSCWAYKLFNNIDNNIDIISAACDGNITKIKSLLKEKVNTVTKQENYLLEVLLVFATAYNHLDLVKWLLTESDSKISMKLIENIISICKTNIIWSWITRWSHFDKYMEVKSSITTLWLEFYIFISINSSPDLRHCNQLAEILAYQGDDSKLLLNATVSLLFILFKSPGKKSLGLILWDSGKDKLQLLLTEEQQYILQETMTSISPYEGIRLNSDQLSHYHKYGDENLVLNNKNDNGDIDEEKNEYLSSDVDNNVKLKIIQGFYAGEDVNLLIKAILKEKKIVISKNYLVSCNDNNNLFNHKSYILPAGVKEDGFGHLEELVEQLIVNKETVPSQILVPFRVNDNHWISMIVIYNKNQLFLSAYDSMASRTTCKNTIQEFVKIINPLAVKHGVAVIQHEISKLRKIQKRNVYCGGYTAHVIAEAAINVLVNVDNINNLQCIIKFEQDADKSDAGLREIDAKNVREQLPEEYKKYGVAGNGEQSREQIQKSNQEEADVHEKYEEEFNRLFHGLNQENQDLILNKLRDGKDVIINKIENDAHKAAIEFLSALRKYCTIELKISMYQNPFGIFFKANEIIDDIDNNEIYENISSLDRYIENKFFNLLKSRKKSESDNTQHNIALIQTGLEFIIACQYKEALGQFNRVVSIHKTCGFLGRCVCAQFHELNECANLIIKYDDIINKCVREKCRGNPQTLMEEEALKCKSKALFRLAKVVLSKGYLAAAINFTEKALACNSSPEGILYFDPFTREMDKYLSFLIFDKKVQDRANKNINECASSQDSHLSSLSNEQASTLSDEQNKILQAILKNIFMPNLFSCAMHEIFPDKFDGNPILKTPDDQDKTIFAKNFNTKFENALDALLSDEAGKSLYKHTVTCICIIMYKMMHQSKPSFDPSFIERINEDLAPKINKDDSLIAELRYWRRCSDPSDERVTAIQNAINNLLDSNDEHYKLLFELQKPGEKKDHAFVVARKLIREKMIDLFRERILSLVEAWVINWNSLPTNLKRVLLASLPFDIKFNKCREEFVKRRSCGFDDSKVPEYYQTIMKQFEIKKNTPRKIAFIVVAHFVHTLPYFLEAVSSLGDIAILISKQSATVPNVRNSISSIYHDIIRNDINKNTLNTDLKNTEVFFQELFEDKKWKDHRFMILDHGGYFALRIHDVLSKFREKIIGIVEHTWNGEERYNAQLKNIRSFPFPVLSIAHSALKVLESKAVAKSIIDALSAKALGGEGLNQSIDNLNNILIIGYGNIGKEVALVLKNRFGDDRSKKVIRICDMDKNKRKEAREVFPKKHVSFSKKKEFLGKAELIITATSKKSLVREDFSRLKSMAIIACATSSDDQFEEDAMADYTKCEEYENTLGADKHPCAKFHHKKRPDQVIYLVANGDSVNFSIGSTSSPIIHAVLASIYIHAQELINRNPDCSFDLKKINQTLERNDKLIKEIYESTFTPVQEIIVDNPIQDDCMALVELKDRFTPDKDYIPVPLQIENNTNMNLDTLIQMLSGEMTQKIILLGENDEGKSALLRDLQQQWSRDSELKKIIPFLYNIKLSDYFDASFSKRKKKAGTTLSVLMMLEQLLKEDDMREGKNPLFDQLKVFPHKFGFLLDNYDVITKDPKKYTFANFISEKLLEGKFCFKVVISVHPKRLPMEFFRNNISKIARLSHWTPEIFYHFCERMMGKPRFTWIKKHAFFDNSIQTLQALMSTIKSLSDENSVTMTSQTRFMRLCEGNHLIQYLQSIETRDKKKKRKHEIEYFEHDIENITIQHIRKTALNELKFLEVLANHMLDNDVNTLDKATCRNIIFGYENNVSSIRLNDLIETRFLCVTSPLIGEGKCSFAKLAWRSWFYASWWVKEFSSELSKENAKNLLIKNLFEERYADVWRYAAGKLLEEEKAINLLKEFFDCINNHSSLRESCLKECPGFNYVNEQQDGKIADSRMVQPETLVKSFDKPDKEKSVEKKSGLNGLGLFNKGQRKTSTKDIKTKREIELEGTLVVSNESDKKSKKSVFTAIPIIAREEWGAKSLTQNHYYPAVSSDDEEEIRSKKTGFGLFEEEKVSTNPVIAIKRSSSMSSFRSFAQFNEKPFWEKPWFGIGGEQENDSIEQEWDDKNGPINPYLTYESLSKKG